MPAVVVIDDEEIFLMTVSVMSERMKYGAICAKNGREALHLFKLHEEKIDTVFLDVMMLGSGAIEVLQTIKTASSDVRVLLSSGYSSDQIERELIDNCDGLLAKPYTLSDLSEKLIGKVLQPQVAK